MHPAGTRGTREVFDFFKRAIEDEINSQEGMKREVSPAGLGRIVA
jgi:hypothetical protein